MCKRLSRLLPPLLLACCFLFSVAAYARLGGHYADADLASEMVLADLLNREGRLLTDSWTYSSELRVVSPVPLYQLGLRLFSSWHAARVFAVAAMLLALLACFLYCARACGLNAGGLYTAAVLALPFSSVYADFAAYGCYYSVFLCLVFLMLGLILRAEEPRRGPLRPALLFALALWGGLGGVRLVMTFASPLFLAFLPEVPRAMRGAKTLREGLRRYPRRPALAFALAGAGMLLGFVINSRVLSRFFTFDSYTATAVTEPDVELAFYQLTEAARFFGFREASRLLSLRGLLSLASLALMGLAFAAPLRRPADGAEKPFAHRILAGYAFFAVCLGVAVNLLTENIACQYYLPGLIALLMTLDRRAAEQPWPRALKTCVCCAFVGVFAANTWVFVREDLPREPAPAEQAAAWLAEEGLARGYATFWNGAVMTMAGGGSPEVWVLEEPTYSDGWRSLKLNEYLQEKRHGREDPEGPVFVYLSPEEAADPPAYLGAANRRADEGWGQVYVYESAEALKEGLDTP